MRTQLMTRHRVTAGLVAGTLLLAACGGGDGGSEAGSGEALPQVDEAGDSADAGAAAPASASPGAVDLVGADVLPESDVASNLLPSVVVDDVNTGRKVNFRNLVPQEKPILLWMYAPH